MRLTKMCVIVVGLALTATMAMGTPLNTAVQVISAPDPIPPVAPGCCFSCCRMWRSMVMTLSGRVSSMLTFLLVWQVSVRILAQNRLGCKWFHGRWGMGHPGVGLFYSRDSVL